MPRLIPTRRRDEDLVVATRTIHLNNSNSRWPYVMRGDVIPRSDHRVQQYPDAFEPAPAPTGTAPGPDQPAAIAQVMFVAADGRMIYPGLRFALNDELVLAQPQFFAKVFPG